MYRKNDMQSRFLEDVSKCVALLSTCGDRGNAYKILEGGEIKTIVFSEEVVARARLIWKRATEGTI